jgi:hypothetical protein
MGVDREDVNYIRHFKTQNIAQTRHERVSFRYLVVVTVSYTQSIVIMISRQYGELLKTMQCFLLQAYALSTVELQLG